MKSLTVRDETEETSVDGSPPSDKNEEKKLPYVMLSKIGWRESELSPFTFVFLILVLSSFLVNFWKLLGSPLIVSGDGGLSMGTSWASMGLLLVADRYGTVMGSRALVCSWVTVACGRQGLGCRASRGRHGLLSNGFTRGARL